jgi:hypothetical protein
MDRPGQSRASETGTVMNEFALRIDHHVLAASATAGSRWMSWEGSTWRMTCSAAGGALCGSLRALPVIVLSIFIIFGAVIGLSFGAVAAIGMGTLLGIRF